MKPLSGATRFARIRARLEAIRLAPGPRAWAFEFLLFGFKQGWACLFGGLMLAGVAGMFGWRLASLQLLEPERFVAHGEAQRIKTLRLRAGRGACAATCCCCISFPAEQPADLSNVKQVREWTHATGKRPTVCAQLGCADCALVS